MLTSFRRSPASITPVSPASKYTRSNSRSTFGGCAAAGGNARYTCATSCAPAAPVFVSAKRTVHSASNRRVGPPGCVFAGEEIAGGAEPVDVAVADAVLLDRMMLAVAVAVAVPLERTDVALEGSADAVAVTVAFSAMEDVAVTFAEITADVTMLAVTDDTDTVSTTAVVTAATLDAAVVRTLTVDAETESETDAAADDADTPCVANVALGSDTVTGSVALNSSLRPRRRCAGPAGTMFSPLYANVE